MRVKASSPDRVGRLEGQKRDRKGGLRIRYRTCKWLVPLGHVEQKK